MKNVEKLRQAGIFEDIYAYTFATPRTTREPGNYPNIFNIMQKEDIVKHINLKDMCEQLLILEDLLTPLIREKKARKSKSINK